jgi:hypothetical protein
MVSASDRSSAKALDLTTHRALAVQLQVDGPQQSSGASDVLDIQLEAGEGTYRDYYIDLDFRGAKTVVIPEPGTDRTLAEFRPAASSYPFKAAMHSFNYANIGALNLRWMRYASAANIQCRVVLVEALAEQKSILKDFEVSTGSTKLDIPGEIATGEYAEYWGDGPIRLFDANGSLIRTVTPNSAPTIARGVNNVWVKASGQGNVKLTAITMGN